MIEQVDAQEELAPEITTKEKSFEPQEELSTELQPKDGKEGRSLFWWLICGLLGLGLISLIATFALAMRNPCGDFDNIEPKNSAEKPLKNLQSINIMN
jgi:hypothetical protein